MRIAELEELVKNLKEESLKLQESTSKAIKKEERAKGETLFCCLCRQLFTDAMPSQILIGTTTIHNLLRVD